MIFFPWLSSLPLTRVKLHLASWLYRIIRLFWRSDRLLISRKGINYEVDLTEAFDFAVFLTGHFQQHVLMQNHLGTEAVIFDVGANYGLMSLPFAQMARCREVHSFEPTHYAAKKFRRNLELNPLLAKKIRLQQVFLSSKTLPLSERRAFSSWKISRRGDVVHPIHGGEIQDCSGVGEITLDDYCEQESVDRLDFIKIDTDGMEWEVLKGARRAVERFRPIVVFEVGRYLETEHQFKTRNLIEFFSSFSYQLKLVKSGRKIDLDNFDRWIPKYWTTDIVALPTTNVSQEETAQ